MFASKRKAPDASPGAITHAYAKNHEWKAGDTFASTYGAYVLTHVPGPDWPVPLWRHVWPRLFSYNLEDACVTHLATARCTHVGPSATPHGTANLRAGEHALFLVTTQIAPMALTREAMTRVWKNSTEFVSPPDLVAYAEEALAQGDLRMGAGEEAQVYLGPGLFLRVMAQSSIVLDADGTARRRWFNSANGVPDGSFNHRAGVQSLRTHPVDGPVKVKKKPATAVQKGPRDTRSVGAFFFVPTTTASANASASVSVDTSVGASASACTATDARASDCALPITNAP